MAKDILHNACKNALIKGGWTITHDPYTLRWGRRNLYIDIGAEQAIAAEKEGRKIAVEVKSLLGTRDVPELERALGQYVLYRSLLLRREPERALYLAVAVTAFEEHFATEEGKNLIADERLKLLVFLPAEERIDQWIE